MPPRKKQRTYDTPAAAVVPRRTTRSTTKAMKASGAVVAAEDPSTSVVARATTPVAVNADNSVRILSESEGRHGLQALDTTGIPERPPFMSEAAFWHLLHSPECHVSSRLDQFSCSARYIDGFTELRGGGHPHNRLRLLCPSLLALSPGKVCSWQSFDTITCLTYAP